MVVPPLPDGVWLQLVFRDSRVIHRVAEDGRYLVTPPGGSEQEQPPLSKPERGAQRLSDAALGRIRAAVDTAGFFDLPASLPPAGGELGAVRLAGGDELRPQRISLTVRSPSGAPHTVELVGDPAFAPSLGTLEPIYAALDREALGGWMNE